MSAPARVGRLPDKAWQFESFEHMPGGNQAFCIRLAEEHLDYWVVRVETFVQDWDDGVSRTFITELSVVQFHENARFGCRQSVVAHNDRGGITPSIPGAVRQVERFVGVSSAGQIIRPTPHLCSDISQGERLIEFIENSARQTPVIVVAAEDILSIQLSVDTRKLARDLLCLGIVYIVSPEISHLLTRRWGKLYSCFHNALRIYYPRFDSSLDSPYKHKLFLPHVVNEWFDRHGQSIESYIVEACAQHSVKSGWTDKRIPQFTTVKEAATTRKRERARAQDDTTLNELLNLADQELEEKQARITELEDDLLRKEEELQEQTQSIDDDKRQTFSLKAKIDFLNDQIASLRNGSAAALDARPRQLTQVTEWAFRSFGDRVFWTSRALRALRDSPFENVKLVCDALSLLANEYWRMRVEGGHELRTAFDEACRNLRVSKEPTGDLARLKEQGDEYVVRYHGKRHILDRHLKNGNARDSRYCLRIYFFFDEEQHQVVLGWLTTHLDSRIT